MKLALLLFYAAGTLAAPFLSLDEDLPKAKLELLGNCQSTRFNQGQTYSYDYAGETLSNIEGATEQSTGMKIQARVSIVPLSECKFAMTLSNTELLLKSKNQDFVRSRDSNLLRRDLEKFELLFTMNGNKIQTLVANTDESSNTLNIKRGILSTLQFDKDGVQEKDVNGFCETSVTAESENTFIETKKLHECSERAQNEYGIQAGSFKTISAVKPLDSTSTCTYAMDKNMIKSVSCQEKHIFRPFSAGYKSESGAMTIVKQSMTFAGVSKVVLPKINIKAFTQETSLIFDHSTEELKSTKALSATAESIMESLITKNSLSAQQNSAHEFTALVMALRKMSQKGMKPIWDKYFECKSCTEDARTVYRQYLLDAIAYCGTSTCVSFVRDVIVDGELQGERVNIFLQSIALVAETSKDMVRDVLEIVKKQPSRQAYLTLGTLMSRHCAKTPKDCEFASNNPISIAEFYLEKKLGNKCEGQNKPERVEEILMVLKAVGNARRPSRFRGVLLKCAENSRHANITHSIFHAFKNMPCTDNLFTDELLKFVKDNQISPEKRIHAFRAALSCPSQYVLERLVATLEKEPSKQVASYMWTTFSNIMESNNPDNEVAKEILKKVTKTIPLKIVDLPHHQYSKYFEKTFGIEEASVTAEGQLIYSPDGYLPRTGMFNLQGNLLGNSIEIFETMVHVEGAENFISEMAGVDGLLSKDLLVEIFNSTMTFDKMKEMYYRHQNEKKEVKMTGRMNKIHKQVNMEPTKPTAHINIKVMGQEVKVFSYDDLYWLIDEIDNMNVIQLLTDVAKGGHKTFTKSLMFLEMDHVVPTGMGLPLKMKLTGSTVASLELDGKFDIRNMFWGPGAIDIKGSIKPSAVVEISGQMGIDSVYASSGIFVNSSMFTSNMLKGSIKYQNGKILKINLDTPEEPIQLFNASSTPFMFLNEESNLIEGTSRNVNTDNCLKSKMVGYGLCTSVRVPFAFREYESPYFPLSGPAHFGVKLVRGDQNLTTYQFLVQMEKKGKETVGEIEFSTPGAYYDRKVGGVMKYSDVWGVQNLIFSTEKSGKTGSMQFNYNPNTKRAFMEARSDFFTPKEVVSRLEAYQTGNMVSQQYGLSYSFNYDWYTFQHESKFMKKESGYMFQTTTTYYPKKSIVGVVEYMTKENKLVLRFDADQLKQAFEFSGQMKKSASGQGIIFTGTHLTTQQSASLYMGYVNEDNTKELITEVEVMGKKASSVMGYYNRNGMQFYEHVIRVNGKTGKFIASVSNTKTNNRVDMQFLLEGKSQGQAFAIITNTKAEKSFFISASAMEKEANAKAGLYTQDGKQTLNMEVNADGRKARIFFDLASAEGYRYTLGALAGEYTAGIRGIYRAEQGQKMCMSMYYGTTKDEQEPMTTCFGYDTITTQYFHKRAFAEIEMKNMAKRLAVTFDIKQQGKTSSLITAFKYNEQTMLEEHIQVTYDGLMNTRVEYKLTVGQYNGGMNMFTKSITDKGQMGFEGFYMKQNAKIITSWDVKKLDKETRQRSYTTEVIVNGKTLPVSTVISMILSDGVVGPSATLKIGDYAASYGVLVSYVKGDYYVMDEAIFTKNEKSVLKVFRRMSLSMEPGKEYEISSKYGALVFDKLYEYGWECALENKGSASKTAFDVIFRVQYSTTRKSVTVFSFANSKKATSLDINVEYFPTKTVSHSIVYTKKTQELAVDVEFLPKMHSKFAVRFDIDPVTGYKKLTTDMGVEWNKIKKSVSLTQLYNNNKQMFETITKFGKNSFGFTYEKQDRKFTVGVKAMSNNVKLVTLLKKRSVQFKLINNKDVLANVAFGYQKLGLKRTFSIDNRGKQVFAISSDYNRILKEATLIAKVGKKTSFGVAGRFQKSTGLLSGSILLNKKTIMKTVVKKRNNNNIVVRFVAMKRDIAFSAQVERKTKTLTLSATSGKSSAGVAVRADWIKKVASITGFLNKKTAGLTMKATKDSVSIKINISRKQSVEVVLEMTEGRVLKMTIYRQNGAKIMKPLKFKLSKKMTEFVMNFDTEYLRDLTKIIKQQMKEMTKDMKKFMLKTKNQSTKYAMKTANKMKRVAMDYSAKIEKTLKKTDFKKMRAQVEKRTAVALKKMSAAVQKAIKQIMKALNQIKKEVPRMRKQLNKMTTQAVKYYQHLQKTLPKELEATLKELGINSLVKKDLAEAARILIVIVNNVTESSRPVVNKAIELIKDFKLRGKTVEELATLAKEFTVELSKVYTELAQKQLEKLQKQGEIIYAKALKMYAKYIVEAEKLAIEYRAKAMVMAEEYRQKAMKMIEEYIKLANEMSAEYTKKAMNYIQTQHKDLLKMQVPYTKKTVAQVIDLVKAKIVELKAKVEEMKVKIEELKVKAEELRVKISKMEPEKMMDEAKSFAMNYKINGKTAQAHFNTLKKDLNKLPVEAKKLLKELKQLIRQYKKQIMIVYREVAEFAEPMTKHIKFVSDRAVIRFSPLIKKALKNLDFDIEMPTMPSLPSKKDFFKYIAMTRKASQEFFMPMVQPLYPMYRKIIKQVRMIELMSVRVGPMMDMNMAILSNQIDVYIKKAEKLMDQEMKRMTKMVNEYMKLTPEQIVDNAVGSINKMSINAIGMSKQAMEYTKKVVAERQQYMKMTAEQLRKIYSNLKAIYADLMVQFNELKGSNPETVLKMHYKTMETKVLAIVTEMQSVMKQISKLDIAGPAKQAWEDAKIVKHLEKYGLDQQKAKQLAQKLKNVELTKTMNEIIELVKEYFNMVRSQTVMQANQVYAAGQKAANYIRSIPKKEYEQWYQELRSFAMENKKSFMKFATTTYKISSKRATKLYNTLVSTSQKNYKDLVDFHTKHVLPVYTSVSRQAQLFYTDIKEPTMVVAKHYRKAVVVAYTQLYKTYEPIVQQYYKDMKMQAEQKLEQLKLQVEELKIKLVEAKAMAIIKVEELKVKAEEYRVLVLAKMEELRIQMEQQYKIFLEKYGDMTWEQVADEIVKYSGSKITMVKVEYTKNIKKAEKMIVKYRALAEKMIAEYKVIIEKMIAEYKGKAEKMVETYKGEAVKMYDEAYAQTMSKYQKYFARFEAELKPKIMVEYKKLVAMYEQGMIKYQELRKQVEVLITKYQTQAVEIRVIVQAKIVELRGIAQSKMTELQGKVMAVYNANKDKPLKTIYREIKALILGEFNKQKTALIAEFEKQKAFLIAQYNEQKTFVVAEYNKQMERAIAEFNTQFKRAAEIYNIKSEDVIKMAEELKKSAQKYAEVARVYARDATKYAATVVFPEAALEMESIINQTLKNSVIMAKVIVEAYTPHFNIIKRESVKYTTMAINEMSIALEKSQVELKKQMKQLKKIAMELIEQVKKHEYTKKAIQYYRKASKQALALYKKTVNEVMVYYKKASKKTMVYYKKAMAQYKKIANHKFVVKTLKKLRELIKMIKQKIAQIKAHPVTRKYSKMARKQYNAMHEEAARVQRKVKKMLKDPRFKKMQKHAQKTMNKMQKSALFTYTKMMKKMSPSLNRARRSVENKFNAAPAHAKKAIAFFVEEPEEAFWTLVNTIIASTKETIRTIESIDFKNFDTELLKDAKVLVTETLNEVVDQWTKKSVKDIYKKVVAMSEEMYANAKVMIKDAKKMLKQLKREAIQTYKTMYKEAMKMSKDAEQMFKRLPKEARQMAIKQYKDNMKQLKKWYRESMKTISQQYANSKLKKMVENKIWNEIVDEIKQHELSEVAYDAAVYTGARASEMSTVAVKELTKQQKVMEQKYAELETIAMSKYAEIKAMSLAKYSELKAMSLAKYSELESMYTDAVTKAEQSYEKLAVIYKEMVTKASTMVEDLDKFLDNTTLEQLVEMIMTKYGETKTQVEQMVRANIKLAKKMTTEYEAKAKAMYKDALNKVEKIYADEIVTRVEEYKTKAMEQYETIKAQVEALYKNYMEQMMGQYNLYREQAMGHVAVYRDQAMTHYNTYYPQAQSKYNELVAKATELKSQSMTMYKLYKNKAEKMLRAYRVKAIELYEEMIAQVMESTIRNKMMAAKKMTIKESIEALKTAPKHVRDAIKVVQSMMTQYQTMLEQYQTTIKGMYGDYSVRAYDEYSKRYNEMETKSTEMFAKIMKEYGKRSAELMTIVEPYMATAVDAYKWVENELTETARFVYRYHRVEERALALAELAVEEYERLAPVVQARFEGMQQMIIQEYKTKIVELKQLFAEYKTMALQYQRDVMDFYNNRAAKLAYDTVANAGDMALRGIHSGMKIIDNIDLNNMKINMPEFGVYKKQFRAAMTELNKYVSIQDGKININIPHDKINKMVNKMITKLDNKAKRTIRIAKAETKKMLKAITKELEKVQARAEVLRKQITRSIMENTVEVRKDLQKSMVINNRIVKRVYANAKLWAQKSYRKMSLQYKTVKSQAESYMAKIQRISNKYYTKMMATSQKMYLKSSKIFNDIYSAGIYRMHKRAYFHAKKYYTMARTQTKKMMKTYKPIVVSMYKKYTKMIRSEAMQMQKDAMPYYRAAKQAYSAIRRGVSVQKAMRPILRQVAFVSRDYQRRVIKSLSKAKSMFCKRDPKLCKYLNEASRIHKQLFNKYSARVIDFSITTKAKLDRALRLMSRYTNRPMFGEYNVAAIMFSNYVLTFDKTYFQMTEQSKDCSYLLAHDFAENQFTVKKEGQSIVVETPEMTVSIKNNGKIKATIGKEIIKTLPVESRSGNCVRKENTIVCNFINNNFKLVVDLDNEVTTLSVSGWYFGRTRGIFGTFNRESYDDWKLPNGQITNNVYDFLNRYELSRKPQCQLKATKQKPQKKCDDAPSYRCQKFFNEHSSPLAQYFDIVDPEPFWDACIEDTKPCGKKVDFNAYCKSVSAFVSFANAIGQYPEYPESCVKYENHRVGDEFKQKPNKKALDVVILVSQKESQAGFMDSSMKKVFKLLHGMLKNKRKMNVKYAVIGFGGAGLAEEAHVKSFNKDHFSNLNDAMTIIKSMKYNGNHETSNDAYMAISEAAQLPFRAGSSKVFILFNANKNTAHSLGSTLDEAKYTLAKEVNAALITFESVDFKHKNAFGQSSRKLYTNRKTVPGSFQLPGSDYAGLAGAYFKKNIGNPMKTAKAVDDVVSEHTKRIAKKCHLCKVHASWNGKAKTECEPTKC